MDVVIVIVIVLITFTILARMFSRFRLQMKGRDRCSFCRARLRKTRDKMGYADTCSKCGRTQPWAQSAA